MEVDDVKALTEGLISLMNNKNQRKSLSDAGPVFIKNHFSVDRMANETLTLYQLALSQTSSIP